MVAKQSRVRRRMMRLCAAALPEFQFGEYEVLVLRPEQRDLFESEPRPAWSIGAKHKEDGHYVDVYCQDTMSTVEFYKGIQVGCVGKHEIEVVAARPERH